MAMAQPHRGMDPATTNPTTNPRVRLEPLGRDNLAQARRLNALLFPVRYSECVYRKMVVAGKFSQLAYFGNVCVGTVGCTTQPLVQGTMGPLQLYIMTLGVLAPYRRLGIGSALLQHILQQVAITNHEATDPVDTISQIALHVQIDNEEALQFYQRHGFEAAGIEQNYYQRMSPSDAFILVKTVAPVQQ
ncbi:N-acetyltransferase 5 [Dimargaris verticillata]|uniref:N-acetyltransferase 5 n=1 Tax=Dimargaris verticillata TaxID=2761393 RepID=A0A9W8EB40_9FUNG|nr:N-acetyltransferase 5 [Dimargaris verticillata]